LDVVIPAKKVSTYTERSNLTVNPWQTAVNVNVNRINGSVPASSKRSHIGDFVSRHPKPWNDERQ